MKLKTLNASRSGLIRAYTSLHADPVFFQSFPRAKKEGPYYTILNHLIISSHEVCPPYPRGSSFHHLQAPSPPHASPRILWPVSSRFAGDIKIIYKTVCVSCDFATSQKQKPRLAVHCCNYFSHHCFHFSLPLSPPQSHDWC